MLLAVVSTTTATKAGAPYPACRLATAPKSTRVNNTARRKISIVFQGFST
jgi:hypothetical protein